MWEPSFFASTARCREPLDKSTRHNYNVIMDELRFEWDAAKNETNKKKHGVSFEEAQTVFMTRWPW